MCMKKLYIVSIFFLISCGTTGSIIGSIESFGSIPVNTGKSISISPSVKEDADSLEFAEYKSLLAQGFRDYGFLVVDEPMDADYWAFFGYEIATKSQTGSAPIIGKTGVSSATATTFGNTTNINYQNSYGVVGSRSYTYTVGDRLVAIGIYDGRSVTKESPDPKKVYELLLKSSGYCKMMYPVMPYFIQAIFDNFPDNRGKFRVDYDVSVC